MEYPEYYKILELPVDAEPAEIKRQYRKLAKKYHPDMNPGDKTAENKFKKLKEAYETLSNEVERSAYDLQWKKRRDTERKARKPENTKSDEKKKTPDKQPKTATPPKKRETSGGNKTKEPADKKRSLKRFGQIFFVSVIFAAVLFLVSENAGNSKNNLLNLWSYLKELVTNGENYFLKRDVLKNDLQKVRAIIEETQENSVTDENIINVKNSDGYSLLMLSQTADMSKMLIENGAEVNYQAPDGATALLLAVRRNNYEQVKVLLEAGANPEVKDPENGYNALIIAQSEEIAYLLLKFGANPNFIAADGTTALSKANADHNRQRLNLLQQFGAQINWSDVLIAK